MARRTLITPSAADVQRQKRLQKDVESATATLDELRGKAAGISAEIAALEQKILDIGGTRLLKQKSAVDGLNLRIKLAHDEITKAEVAEGKAEKDAARHGEAIAANTAALAEVAQELEEAEAALETLHDFLSELRENVKLAQAAKDEQEEAMDKLRAKLAKKTEQIQEFRQKEVRRAAWAQGVRRS
jgi:structural maintenance of chromosome 4